MVRHLPKTKSCHLMQVGLFSVICSLVHAKDKRRLCFWCDSSYTHTTLSSWIHVAVYSVWSNIPLAWEDIDVRRTAYWCKSNGVYPIWLQKFLCGPHNLSYFAPTATWIYEWIKVKRGWQSTAFARFSKVLVSYNSWEKYFSLAAKFAV